MFRPIFIGIKRGDRPIAKAREREREKDISSSRNNLLKASIACPLYINYLNWKRDHMVAGVPRRNHNLLRQMD